MTPHASENRPDASKTVRNYLWAAAGLVLGYIMAIAAGSVVFALLLQFLPNFEAPHAPHGGTTDLVEKLIELTTMCFFMGAIFGLPYTIAGSLAFWFLLPRKTPIFLLIGAFCPTGALLTMGLFFGTELWWDVPFVLYTLPAGMIAAYFYGAVGFGQGFWRWRFA